ncbi:MAG: hypothetical protein KAJ19_20455, partial [Gammaproteobacteria bacterium]|nr:hypothetical protein [Gammaproteobacteria bacterium]
QGPVNSFGQVAGGAIWSDASESSITIVNCRFTNNRAYEAEYYAYYNYDFYNTEYELIELYTRGGAIYADNSTTITLDNCDFTENFGGALFCGAESDITIDGCTFTGNMGLSQSDSLEKGSFESGEDDAYDPFGYYGDYIDALEGQAGGNLESPAGAVDLGPFGLLTVVNSDFRDNFTSDHGGAVHSRSDVSFTTSSFSGNSAGGNGGAVYIFENVDPNYLGVPITNLSLTIDTCSFSGNTAFAGGVHAGTALGGGGLCADHFEGSITDTYFLGNTSQNGGGLCLVDGIVDITGGGINANTARANYGLGGGFACINTDTVISDCMIQDNKLTGDDSRGGGVAFYGGDAAMAQVMSNCLVTGNESVSDGGGVYCAFEANAEISNTTFSDNSAGTYGGAIACNWDADPNIIDSIFNNCGPYAISEEKETVLIEEDIPSEIKNSLFNNIAVADYAEYDHLTGDVKTLSFANIDPDHTINITYSDIITGDPEFVAGPIGNYYLSHEATGQLADSVCVDAGDPGVTVYSDPNYTTRTDSAPDIDNVDIGYHYPNAVNVDTYELTVTVVGGHGTADPIGTGKYLAGSAVTITATPDAGYRIDTWSGGTVNDSTKEVVNVVVMGSDKNIEIRFEQPSTLVVGSTSEYTSIQRTIEAAEDGDTVLIPVGVYDAVDWFDVIRIINKSVTLSGFNPDDPDAVAATVLSGYHITIANAGPQTLIQGLTITRSRMRIYNSKCRLQNVDFLSNNWTGLDGFPGEVLAPTGLKNIGGHDGGDGTSIFGGALAIFNSSPIIANTRFIDCSATGGDGGEGEVGKLPHPIGGDGGWAGKAHGGAVYITTESHPEFYNCVFENCFAQGGNGGDGGDDGPGLNHGGRGGNWEWSDSLEELYWHFSFWWDGWSYGYMFDEKYGPYARFEDNWQYQSYGTWGGFGDWSADWSIRDWENYWRDYNAYIWPTWREWTTIFFTFIPYTGVYDPHWEYSGYGGAVYCRDSSSMKFEDCIFNNNSTLGGFSGVGGNNWPKPDRPISMENFGGAVYVKEDCNVEFTGCLFDDNVADRSLAEDNDDYYVSYGGAVAFEEN